MYELINNQLQKVEEVVTPNQKAIIKTTIEMVYGYDSNTTITFDSIPKKEEIEGKISELYYANGVLEWQYKDKPMTQEEYIKELENQVLLMADSASGGIL